MVAKEEIMLITPPRFSQVVVKENSPSNQSMVLYLNIVDLSYNLKTLKMNETYKLN